mgnify:FL=1
MWRWLLKRRLRRDLVGNVLYAKVELLQEDGSTKLYCTNGFDEEYLKFIDLAHFGQFAIKWSDIKHGWNYLGVDIELWWHFENLAQRRDLERLMVKQAVESLEGNRYRIPAYQDPDGVWFYITQSHNFRGLKNTWGVTLYRGEEDQGPGMRAVPYSSCKGGIEWQLGPRERQPKWGLGVPYNQPHHWLTVDALEATEGKLPPGNVLYLTRRDGIVRYHVGKTTVYPELLPAPSTQPMAIDDSSVRMNLQNQLRLHYADELIILDYFLNQQAVYREHYDKYVRDFMRGRLPGERLVLSPTVALVAGPYGRMVVLEHANHSYSHMGLMHIQDGTKTMHQFSVNELRKLRDDFNIVLHGCGVKAEDRLITFEVE